jgi:hypothetical protein
MSFRTIEVDVIEGQVRPTGNEHLPKRAHALLTIVNESSSPQAPGTENCLKKFLELPRIPVSAEQVRNSLDEDFYDQ